MSKSPKIIAVPRAGVSNYEIIRVLRIGVSNSENFPGFEPATADSDDTYLTAMLSLHAT